MSFECPKIVNYGRRKKGRPHLDEMESVVARSEVIELWVEKGENLVMRNILLQCEIEVEWEP